MDGWRIAKKLQALLDDVDARDSLAFLEKHDDAVREQARAAAIAECAKACDGEAEAYARSANACSAAGNSAGAIHDGCVVLASQSCARAVRALAAQPALPPLRGGVAREPDPDAKPIDFAFKACAERASR